MGNREAREADQEILREILPVQGRRQQGANRAAFLLRLREVVENGKGKSKKDDKIKDDKIKDDKIKAKGRDGSGGAHV